MSSFYVYLITGPGGKMYVGITSRDPKTRWYAHLRAVVSGKNVGSKLHEAVRKYGAEAFMIETLRTHETWEEACASERELIAKYDTFNHGYNATQGGEGTLGFLPTTETRALLSRQRKGVPKSEAHKAAISAAKKGKRPNGFSAPESIAKVRAARVGKKFDPEWREKIREGVRKNWEVRRARAQIEKGDI